MPIVTITMFEGRSEYIKDRIAREVSAVIAEYTRNNISDVHVIFDEKGKDQWARGTVLASRREGKRTKPQRAEHVGFARIKYTSGTEKEYLRLRRDVIEPGMGTQPGFVSSLLVQEHGKTDEFLLITRWETTEHSDAYRNSPIHDELKRQALSILPQPLEMWSAEVVHQHDPE